MQCRQCGAPLRVDEGVCLECGAAQPQEPRDSGRGTPQVPVAVYAPSPQGPPVARGVDSLPAASVAWLAPTDDTAPLRRQNYHPVVLPSTPLRRFSRRRRLSRSALALLALFAVLGLAAGLVARAGDVPILGLAAMRGRPTATATAGSVCPAAPLTYTTTPALGSLQLTTALKNVAQHDYRPVNNVTHFSVGAQGYVTFKVLSSLAGTAGAVVCTPGRILTGGPVQVPKGSAGQYVEFQVGFRASDVGQGMVTITWDGAVLGNRGFAVTR